MTEATVTEGYYNGEWITYNTPCDTTPFSDNVCSDGDAGTCCEIPFGLTR